MARVRAKKNILQSFLSMAFQLSEFPENRSSSLKFRPQPSRNTRLAAPAASRLPLAPSLIL